MRLKRIGLLLVLLLLFIWGCQNPDTIAKTLPSQLESEEAIHTIISSRGLYYDYLKDTAFMNQLRTYATSIAERENRSTYNITYGNLDLENKVPEIAIYLKRDINDIEDPSELLLLKYIDEQYQIVDRIEMNYDNENINFIIGPVSEDKNGLFITNEASAHAGCTYVYGLDNNRLTPLVQDRKINMFSAYPYNEIRDINDDNVLEWSIIVYNPDSATRHTHSADTMDIWYQWDGYQSAKVIDLDRKIQYHRIDENIYEDTYHVLREKPEQFLSHMKNNIALINKKDATELIRLYMDYLAQIIPAKNEELYQIKNRNQAISPLSQLNLEEINSVDYLRDPMVLPYSQELKKTLINNIELGLFLDNNQNTWQYEINYPLLQQLFGKQVFRELDDYFTIRGYEYTEATLAPNNVITIPMAQLAERIIMTDNFIVNYPYSSLTNYIKKINEMYVRTFFFGTKEDPSYYVSTLEYRPEVLDAFQYVLKEYPFSFLAENIKFFIKNLDENDWKINDALYQYINEEYPTTQEN